MFRKKQLVSAIVAAIAASATAGAYAEIEEVIVTATKQSKPMQDIPVSIQAMTGETLEELGVSNFDEYAQYLSNVVVSGRGPGQ